jgi:hypothetical protein
LYVFQWQQKSDLEKLSEDQLQSVKLQSEDQQLRKDQLQKEKVQVREKLLRDDDDSSNLQNITLSQRLMR